MSLVLARVSGAINRFGTSVEIGASAVKALLRPLNMSQLQTYISSGTFASWPRPVFGAILPASAAAVAEDDFSGPDFDGEIRLVHPVRLAGTVIAKFAIISKNPPEITDSLA